MSNLLKSLIAGFLLVLIVAAGGGYYLYKKAIKQKAAIQKLNEKKPEVKLTFIEGTTNKDYALTLTQKNITDSNAFFAAIQRVKMERGTELSGISDKSDLLGFLFPDTYRFFEDVTPDEVVVKMLDTFESRLKSIGVNSADKNFVIPGYDLKMDLNKVVTLASIIEKETGRDLSKAGAVDKERLDNERKIVAGVFYNRLEKGLPLESDATINFVTGKNDASPLADDLQSESAYNTYKNPGLPPTPICNPSLSSLEAAFFPTKTDYFFFLHKQPSGEAVFSKNFEEHVRNKFKYLK